MGDTLVGGLSPQREQAVQGRHQAPGNVVDDPALESTIRKGPQLQFMAGNPPQQCVVEGACAVAVGIDVGKPDHVARIEKTYNLPPAVREAFVSLHGPAFQNVDVPRRTPLDEKLLSRRQADARSMTQCAGKCPQGGRCFGASDCEC